MIYICDLNFSPSTSPNIVIWKPRNSKLGVSFWTTTKRGGGHFRSTKQSSEYFFVLGVGWVFVGFFETFCLFQNRAGGGDVTPVWKKGKNHPNLWVV